MKREIVVVKGDGIGVEVMDAVLLLLDELDLSFDYNFCDAGYDCYVKTGTNLPVETVDFIRESDACLLGAVTSVPDISSAIVSIRHELDLFANVRPVKSLPGVNGLYNDLDFVIVRENTEGLYSGIEEVYDDYVVAKRVISRNGSSRICDFAFDYCVDNGYSRVCGVHKANVLKKSDGLFKDVFYKCSEGYSGVDVSDFYVDAAAMYLVQDPYRFDVIVTSNLFGDILSDEGAGLVGGLGLVPSANIGVDCAVFEPVHGSAPDIAGEGVANPTAMVLSAVMMLRYLGEKEKASVLEKSLFSVLSYGDFLTPDIGGCSSTNDMAQAIANKINSIY